MARICISRVDIQLIDFDSWELCKLLMDILYNLQMVMRNTKLLKQYSNRHFFMKDIYKNRWYLNIEFVYYLYSHRSDTTDFIPYNPSVTIGVNSVPPDDVHASVADNEGQISLIINSDTIWGARQILKYLQIIIKKFYLIPCWAFAHRMAESTKRQKNFKLFSFIFSA